MSLAPRYAIVTGAASGLGRALAVRLARDGWHIAIADINDAGATETLDLVRAAGGDGQVEHLDVSQPDQWAALGERLRLQWPQLDLLVNNAGVAAAGEVVATPLADWHWLLATNLFGVIYGCHTFVDWLKQNPRGAHLINTASAAGLVSLPRMAVYNASKAAVISLSETLHAELAKDNVGVSVLCPSFFQTHLLNGSRMLGNEERTLVERSMAVARITADDVAEAAVRAIRRRRLYVLMPLKARLVWRIKRLIPWIFTWFLGKRYAIGLPESI